jgi:hypothetical protein
MIGQTILHYRIVEELGGGEMGFCFERKNHEESIIAGLYLSYSGFRPSRNRSRPLSAKKVCSISFHGRDPSVAGLLRTLRRSGSRAANPQTG